LLYFASLFFFVILFCTCGNPPENIRKRTYVKRNLSRQPTRRFHANHRFECGDSAQESPSRNSAGFRVAFTPAKDGRISISKNSCLGPGLRGLVGATLRGRRANDLLKRTSDRRVAKIKRFEFTVPDMALSRGAMISHVSRRYWPWIRAPLRAGLMPLSIARSRETLWCGRS